MLINLIREGSILLLPLPMQKGLDEESGIKMLMDGRNLIEKLKRINEMGENNQLVIYQMLYKNIKTIELVEQGNSILPSSYKIFGNENASYKFIMIFLPGTDTKFINELKSHLG